MSIQRCTQPLTSSFGVFKFASIAANPVVHTRPSKPFLLSSYNYAYLLSKRKLSTVTEYNPHSLDSAPPPPRNANIPDTSIAGLSPEVNNSRPPRQTGQYDSPLSSTQPEKQSIGLSEAEAQKTQPVIDTSTTPPASKPTKRPPKLRPRKAAMSLTPIATRQLHDLLALPEPKFIRVGVKNRGCSGLAYHLEYVDKAGKFDEAVEQDGVKVLIDSKALFSIIGSEMDWVEDKLSQRFVFRNPNIKEQCGCGESFMV